MAETLPALPVDLSDLAARAAEFARSSRSAATERAYRSDWADFSSWCGRAGLSPLPASPATVGAYLTARASELKVATLNRRLAAITVAHRTAGLGLDGGHLAIAQVLAGIRRAYGTRQTPKTAILTEDLRRVIRSLPTTTLAGIRDRALLLTGFAGAFRRSELAALDLADLSVSAGGVVITIRRGKTDQEGAGRQVGIPRARRSSPTCPVAALESWLAELSTRPINLTPQIDRERNPNALFRAVFHGRLGDRLSGHAVAEIVKRAVSRLGFDPRNFAGHSLRSGFATSAARGGADLAFIMQQTGHKNADVARRYVHAGALLQNPASKAVKL
jgi:site-specific recombinase XerD